MGRPITAYIAGNLDAETGRRVIALLGDLVRERGMTVLLVTHSGEGAASADWSLHCVTDV